MFSISIQHNRREIAVQSIYIEFLEKFNAEFSHKNLKVILKSFDQHLPPDEVKKLTDTIHLLSDPSDLDRMKGASVRYHFYFYHHHNHHHNDNENWIVISFQIAFAAIALESKSKLSEARWIELLSEDRPILKIDKWTITSEGIAYSNRRSIQEIIEYEVKPPDAERIISYIVCAYDPNVADGVRQMCMVWTHACWLQVSGWLNKFVNLIVLFSAESNKESFVDTFCKIAQSNASFAGEEDY